MDAFGEIGVFVRVVDARGFARAAQAVGLTAAGVSRVVSRLEARLGVRLIDRTTRSMSLTAEGAVYYERCAKILRDLAEANTNLAVTQGSPRGKLRVDAPTVLGRFGLGPAIPQFLAAYPDLSLELSFRDHVIDPIAEGIDVVVRMAPPRTSDLVRRRVGALRVVTVASRDYLARRGLPTHPNELGAHDLLGRLAGAKSMPWRFRVDGEDVAFPPTGRLHTSNADALRAAVLAGLGVAQVLELNVRAEVAAGSLVVLLRDHERPPLPIHALFTRDKADLPKVRVFLDFLAGTLAS